MIPCDTKLSCFDAIAKEFLLTHINSLLFIPRQTKLDMLPLLLKQQILNYLKKNTSVLLSFLQKWKKKEQVQGNGKFNVISGHVNLTQYSHLILSSILQYYLKEKRYLTNIFHHWILFL